MMSGVRDDGISIPMSGGMDLVPASHILSLEQGHSSSNSNSYELGSFESIGDTSSDHVISLETSCDSLFNCADDVPPPVPPPLLTPDQVFVSCNPILFAFLIF
jgi:hypothetical protein